MIFANIYNWFFDVPDEPRSVLQIVLWWEKRRVPFNILIGLVGILSLVLLFIFVGSSITGHPGEDIVEPISILFAPFVINFCYTLGWIVEIAFGGIWKKDEPNFATKLLRFGTGFSLFLISAPTIIWGIIFLLGKIGLVDKLK
jgi:hypothetical protein